MSALLQLEGVTKAYVLGEARVEALKGVSLSVERGEFAAVTGPSGSGKSTLLHACGLIDAFDAGRYRLEGEDVTAFSPRARTLIRRQKMGFVFQSFNLIPVMSAFENVEYPLLLAGVPGPQRRERTQRALERVGLAGCEDHLPDRLSGGQRQRVAVARALVKEPSLVLADEPTANLDTQTALRVIDLMKELGRELGTTFLVATHDGRMTERCDRVLRLVDGRLA